MLGAAALALGGALLRPSLAIERPLFNHVVVLDVTQSMNVLDAPVGGKPVSRLEHAKQALREALLQLPCESKLGLGLFTEYRSYLLLAPVEVCANLQELRSTLAHIDGRMAWTGNSEVAKGLFSGLAIARQLADKPALGFVTDGHEAPPLDARHWPRFNQQPGEVSGWIVGVGGPTPLPIPKIDPLGRPLRFWRSDEVLHADPRSANRDAVQEGVKSQGSRTPFFPARSAPAPPGGRGWAQVHAAARAIRVGCSHDRTRAGPPGAGASRPALATGAAAGTSARWRSGLEVMR